MGERARRHRARGHGPPALEALGERCPAPLLATLDNPAAARAPPRSRHRHDRECDLADRPYNDGEMEATTPSRRWRPGRALLELDPELGRLLTAERRVAAEHELRVRVTTFPSVNGTAAAWPTPTRSPRAADRRGRARREVVLGDTVSTELLGPGDIVRPWHIEGPPELLPVTVRWNALSAVRLGCSTAARHRDRPLPGDQRGDRRPPVRARAAARDHPGHLPAQPRRPAPARALLAPRRALGPRRARRHRRAAGALAPADRRARRRAPADDLDGARRARPRGPARAARGRHVAADRRADRGPGPAASPRRSSVSAAA